MPLALAIVAVLLIVTAVKGNYQAVFTQFNTTFFGATGQPGFLLWFGSILGIAALFRLLQAPRAGELFIALLILVYFLQNNNILASLESSLSSAANASSTTTQAGTGNTVAAPAAPATPST